METKKIEFNHNELKGFFVSKGMKIGEVANLLGITRQCLTNKLNNRNHFTFEEIDFIQRHFKLSDKQVKIFFFTKVAKKKQND